MKKQIEIVVAVIKENHRILALQKGYGTFKGLWEFPGGKIEANETKEEALIREIKEELDVEIEVGEHIGSFAYEYDAFDLKMDAYFVEDVKGILVLKEHWDLKWLDKHTLGDVNWIEGSKELVEQLKKKL